MAQFCLCAYCNTVRVNPAFEHFSCCVSLMQNYADQAREIAL